MTERERQKDRERERQSKGEREGEREVNARNRNTVRERRKVCEEINVKLRLPFHLGEGLKHCRWWGGKGVVAMEDSLGQ